MPNITLELERGADPIQGRIGCPDGTYQPFWGWLELSGALDELRCADGPMFSETPQNCAKSTSCVISGRPLIPMPSGPA